MPADTQRKFAELSPFGGNVSGEENAGWTNPRGEHANFNDWYARYQEEDAVPYEFRRQFGDEAARAFRDWAVSRPAASALDKTAAERQRLLGLPTQSRYQELMGARAIYDRARQRQIDLLGQIAARQSAVPMMQQATLNQVQEQLAAATDPRARLAGLKKTALPVAAQAASQRVGEQAGIERGTIGGAGQIRGQDLGRAAQEAQELARQVNAQMAKERLALGMAQTGEADIASMAGAELGLAGAQRQGGVDFWRDIFPGLTVVGSAGLGAAASWGGNQPPQGLPGMSPVGVSPPMGNPAPQQYGPYASYPGEQYASPQVGLGTGPLGSLNFDPGLGQPRGDWLKNQLLW